MPSTISPEYLDLNRRLHGENEKFGTSGAKYAGRIEALATAMGRPTILDYGCGKGRLAASLPGLVIAEYDPAIEGKNGPPEPADLVACTDVLEHIEPEYLDAVLADLRRLMRTKGFFNIATRPAVKVLADGRNAHLIVENEAWWRDRLKSYFEIVEWEIVGDSAVNCVVTPRQ